jgi:putative PIN family toxin of toxin-antitoxin system
MTDAPAVIDTNVVVSGVLTSLAVSPTARILDAMLAGRFRFLLSLELLSEYREVLLRARIRRRHGLSPAEIDVILTEITAAAQIVQIGEAGPGPRRQDEHLRRILAAVPSARLVTGDRRLAGSVAEAGQALTPKEFAESLSV